MVLVSPPGGWGQEGRTQLLQGGIGIRTLAPLGSQLEVSPPQATRWLLKAQPSHGMTGCREARWHQPSCSAGPAD